MEELQSVLQSLHKQVGTMQKVKPLPELVMTIEGLGQLARSFGQMIIEMEKMHATYKAESEEYMQILLEEIRLRTRQLDECKSRSEESMMGNSKMISADEVHRISYDDSSH